MPAKPTKEKPPVKKKRATPVKFNDEKIDNIVKEITENLKNDDKADEELEALLAEKLGKKKEEQQEPSEEKVEASEKSEKTDDLVVDEPFDSEEVIEDTKEQREDEKESEHPEEQEKEAATDDTDSEEKSDTAEKEEEQDRKEEATHEERNEREEEKSSFSSPHEDNPFPPLEEEKKRGFLWPIIYLVLFVAGMATGFVIFDQLSSRQDFTFTLPKFGMGEPSPTPTTEPTATPTPEAVNLADYSVRLENGSGIAGEAGRLQDILEKADFNVDSVGNADNSDYEETVIQAKNGTNAQFLEELRQTLEKTYIVSDDLETLEEDEDVDAVVIIGSEKKE